jgi:putative membrane protein
MNRKASSLAIAVSVVALTACQDDKPMAGLPDTPATTSDAVIPGAAAPDAAPPVVILDADVSVHVVSTTLTDAQILQITHTANLGEIEQAKLAASKAKDARVKTLASMMAKDHTDADAEGVALVAKEQLAPSTSSASTALDVGGKNTIESLRSKSGTDFDKAYVDAQVKEHQTVLDTIDQQLIPAAREPELKAYLAKIRPKIAMHHQHALELQSALSK